MSIFRDDLFKNRTVLITGGGGDICSDIATVYSAHGANVCITSRKQERIDEAAKVMREKTGGEVLAVAGDVRNNDDVERVVKTTADHFGGIDILINGAAGNFPAPISSLSPNGFKTVIDIDLQGTYQMTKACFEPLKLAAEKNGDASIVNITATLYYTGMPFQAHVNAAKAGIDALTRTVANEWGPLNIRCNSIAPGPIADTEGMRRLAPTPELTERSKQGVPLRRFGTVREISDACLFLTSEASRFTTGAILVVDGGSWLFSPGIGGMSV
jgi:peroxisomal 2,4-dienoyl-CoA reductase